MRNEKKKGGPLAQKTHLFGRNVCLLLFGQARLHYRAQGRRRASQAAF
jgi:hypothetical protein